MNRKIDFFIIGAQKSATTSLYDFFNGDSNFSMPLVKEAQLFTDDSIFERLDRNISAYYDTKKIKASSFVGLADVEILYKYENTVERIRKYNSRAKIIIVLRNPIDRAYSSYLFSRKNQKEECDSFEKAILEEGKRLDSLSGKDRIALTYLNVGLYYRQVKSFVDAFGREQVKVIVMEEMFKKQSVVLTNIMSFLGVEINVDNKGLPVSNEGGGVKYKLIQRMIFKNGGWRIYKKIIPLSLRMKIRNLIITPIIRFNNKKEEKFAISESTRSYMIDYYREDVNNLSGLLEKDLKMIWRDFDIIEEA